MHLHCTMRSKGDVSLDATKLSFIFSGDGRHLVHMPLTWPASLKATGILSTQHSPLRYPCIPGPLVTLLTSMAEQEMKATQGKMGVLGLTDRGYSLL